MAFALGISITEFKFLTPKKLELCLKGHEIRKKMIDDMLWSAFGNYGIPATAIGASKLFSNDKVSFPDKPISLELGENKALSKEEDIRLQREAFMMKMQAIKANYRLSHDK